MITGSLLPALPPGLRATTSPSSSRRTSEAGIPTHYVSMQNEPLYEPADYPGMGVLPDQAGDVHRRPPRTDAGTRAGLDDTKILGYDHNWDITDYPEAMYSDRRVARPRGRHRLALLRR